MANDRKATLGTKNRDRWMVLSTGARMKMKVHIEVPFPKLVATTILKVMASERSPKKNAKNWCRDSNCVVDSNKMNGPNVWLHASLNCKFTQMWEQYMSQ